MSSLSRDALIGVAIVLLQWLVLERLEIYGATPDAVLLWVLWVSLRYDRRTGSIAGFLAGLLADVTYGPWMGMNMFLKTFVGFLGGFFSASEREILFLRPGQAFVGGLVGALVHNGLAVAFIWLETGNQSLALVTSTWLGASLYTAVLAFIAGLFYNR